MLVRLLRGGKFRRGWKKPAGFCPVLRKDGKHPVYVPPPPQSKTLEGTRAHYAHYYYCCYYELVRSAGDCYVLRRRPTGPNTHRYTMATFTIMNRPGINLKNYEAAVASILSKCESSSTESTPHFPPKFYPLPSLPQQIICSCMPQISLETSDMQVQGPTSTSADNFTCDGKDAQNKKKATSRLAKKRAARKLRAEAEERGTVQPPCWPFDILPPAACPRYGGKLSGRRARKKEGQLNSMIRCVLSMFPEDEFGPLDKERMSTSSTADRIRIVDFAGGSGHLALPLALLLPRCQVVIVDLKQRSLEVARERAKTCGLVSNLETYHGSITTYSEPFDMGLALHACGEATDLVLRACGKAKASFVAAPCCVGKLSTTTFNPYIYLSSGDNTPAVQYPQSDFYRTRLGLRPNDFDALAKAADHAEEDGENINSIKRAAKIFLEADRLAAAVERYGYDRDNVALTRMEPLDASPKNDILLGWGASSGRSLKPPYPGGESGKCCNQDPYVAEAKQRLSSLLSTTANNTDGKDVSVCIDWTSEEEMEIREQLKQEFATPSQAEGKEAVENRIFRFPTGMGSRLRRLIHYVAEDMGLTHWGKGKKGKEKTVCVAIERPSS